LPYLPLEILNCVVFIGYKDGQGNTDFVGSAFWIARLATDEGGDAHRLAYLVTAAHNIDKIKTESADGYVWLRVNIKGDGWKWEPVAHTDSFATSREDKNLDIAVLKIPINTAWDNIAWPFESLVERDSLDTTHTGDRKVELGDELILAGLFYPHEGKERNIPVVRIGHVAALRGEPVTSKDGRPMDLYLIESHSIGGLSGAPVFIDIATAKLTLPPTWGYMGGAHTSASSWSRFKLFGIVHGHFGVDDIVKDAMADDGNGKVPINFGISMVIPAEKITEVVQRFATEEQLEMAETAKKKRSLVIPDSVASKTTANISFHETGTGFEIPVSTKGQPLDLNKASSKKE
jgi:hypothetical protein